MKKFFPLLAMVSLGAVLVSCSDVPEPYGINLTAAQSELSGGQVFTETFASTMGSFQSKAVTGDYAWSNQGHGCVQISSYVDGTNNEADAFLLSPKVTLEDEPYHFTFQYILRYGQAATLKQNHTVVISKDYNGDLAAATWEALDFTPVEGTDWNTWQTADLAIPADYQGQEVVVAFRYIGTSAKAATWEVKNVTLSKGTAGGEEGGEENPDDGTARTLPYSESFATTLGGFTSQTTSGSGAWVIDFSTAKATGYDGATKVTTAGTYFLVSPAIDLGEATAAHVAYEYILRYNKGDENQQVLLSADYAGDAAKATWTVLKKKHTEGSDWNTFSTSDITIPETFLGKTVRIAFLYNTNATSGSTWEVKNFSVKAGTGTEAADGAAYGGGGGETPAPAPAGEAQGAGTAADPYNVAAAFSLIQTLAADVNSTEVYIKGKISEIKSIDTGQFGNAEYYISDDGTTANQLLVYRGYALNGDKFTSATQLKVGDEVVIVGKLVNFRGTTPEVTTGSKIVSLNGSGGSVTPTPTPAGGQGAGTAADPYNVAAAFSLIETLAADVNSAEVYIRGKISEIKSIDTGQFGNAEYYISDDGTTANQLLVYRGYGLNGDKFTSASQLQVGYEVIIVGKLVNFRGTTPEVTTGSKIVSLNDEGGVTPTPTPEPAGGTTLDDFANGDFESWSGDTPTGWDSKASFTDCLSKSNVAHGGSYSCKITHSTNSSGRQNTRLAYKELSLTAGSYTISAWVRAESSVAVARLGHYNGSAYAYGGSSDFFNGITTEWTQISKTFEITSAGTYSFIIMNSKNGEDALLVDDVTITKSN